MFMNKRRQHAFVVAAIVLSLTACTTTSPPVYDRYAITQTAVIATQSAAQAFGLVYQTQKAHDPAGWVKRYDLALVSYQGSQLLLLTAISEATLTESKVALASWDALRERISMPFETLAGPR